MAITPTTTSIYLAWLLIAIGIQTHARPFLSEAEQRHLDKIQHIDFCIDPHWLPFEGIDPMTGEAAGYSSAIINEISKHLNKPFILYKTSNWSESLNALNTGKCSLTPLLAYSHARLKHYDFSPTYLKNISVLVSQNHVAFIDGLKDIPLQTNDPTLAVVRDYFYIDTIKYKHPELTLVEATTLLEALQHVENNKAYAAIGSLYNVLHLIKVHRLDSLKVVGPTQYEMSLALGLPKNSPLTSIVSKALHQIPQQRKDEIYRTLRDHQDPIKDYTLTWQVLLAATGIIIIVYLRSLTHQKFNQELTQINAKLKESNQQLEALSCTDPLTQAINRRKFTELAHHELKRCTRYSSYCSLIILDLDHFKHINDLYGHSVGDEVLIAVSKQLKSKIRECDNLCRWGGEEFVILLPETKLDDAILVAQKIQAIIRNTSVSVDTLTISASIGVTQWNGHEGLDTLISRADEKMYDGKRAGRDRIIF